MDPRRYESDTYGRPARRPGDKWAYWYFLPEFLPRELVLDEDTIVALADAENALGHLQGAGKLIRDPELLLGPYLTREALASSRIEGTQASLSDVFQAEAAHDAGGGSSSDDVAEVERYVAAAKHGFELIKTLPVTQRLIMELHAELMHNVRGEEKSPGEVRRSPVWVGSSTDKPESALFVPPLPEHLDDLLADWERFVNTPSRIPVLVRCALMHYQFETIHPFLDGNGRIGRLLIVLMLMQEKRLDEPILYISGYLEANRREYYDRLQGVRETGDIQSWIRFFLAAVQRQSEDGVERAVRLVTIREELLSEAQKVRSRLPVIVDLVFRNPFITVKRVQLATGHTEQGARNLIKQAEARGWLRSVGSFGRGGRAYWVAERVLSVLQAPTRYDSVDYETTQTDSAAGTV